MHRAAFFDMDRTVLKIDTGLSWMKFSYRRRELSALGMGRAICWSLLYKAALLDMESVASRLVADLEGDSEQQLIDKCRIWYHAFVADQVAPAAETTIERHRGAGEMVVMLTGSTQYAAGIVSRSLNMDHTLSSRIEVVDGRFTGKLEELCFGVHKVRLAERFADQHGVDLDRSVFYSDSYNDLPMMLRVGEAVAVNPDARLRRHALRAGWRIERWAP